MQPVADSMATHCAASGVVPRARQFDTTDCPTPIADASLLTPPTMVIARSSAFMEPSITAVIEEVNTLVIHSRDEITTVETQGERLKRLREEKKLSQTKLASAADVSQGTIGNLEAGTRSYGKSIVGIAQALGVSADYLQCLTEVRSQTAPASQVVQIKPRQAGALAIVELGALMEAMTPLHRKMAALVLEELSKAPEKAQALSLEFVNLLGGASDSAEPDKLRQSGGQ